VLRETKFLRATPYVIKIMKLLKRRGFEIGADFKGKQISRSAEDA
jgi:hypothetical protein